MKKYISEDFINDTINRLRTEHIYEPLGNSADDYTKKTMDPIRERLRNIPNISPETLQSFDNNITDIVKNSYAQGSSAGYHLGGRHGVVSGIGVSAGAAAVGVGVVGAINLIRSVFRKNNWKKTQCNGISDMVERARCTQYINKQTLKELSKALTKCQDEKCKNKIKKEMSNLEI